MSLYNNDYSLEIASSYENILSINEEDFYEISPFSIKLDNLVLEFGEEWRVYDKEWKDKVRFIIYTTKIYDDVRIYHCNFAQSGDPRRPGFYYVSKNKVKNSGEMTP